MSAGTLLLVGLAGAVGALLRFVVDSAVMQHVPRPVPLGTLAVNVSAALLLGLITGIAASTATTLIAGTGLMGGYSTFSTWMLETQRLAEDGDGRWALANIGAPIVIGLLAIVAGRLLGQAL
ncbi:fluoride efflux transporter CrcB [Patulibacter sp. S7RM1-6]